MTESINDLFRNGLLIQAYQAERNILIWQYIGEERIFIEKQTKEIKDLYSFVQQSAQTNFILSLGKLFDKPDKRFPTRCILYFLKSLEENYLDGTEIIETTNTIKLLNKFNCPENLISAVTATDKTLFPKLFAELYKRRYFEPYLQVDINTLKLMRDKVEAHNEATASVYFDFETSTRLLNFSSELISIFGMAYLSDRFSLIKANAERSAYFIKANIIALKKNPPDGEILTQ